MENSEFQIQNDANSKTSKCIFRCLNNKCRNRISIRINSFFALFPKIKLRVISEIIKSFLNENNAQTCFNNLKKELNQSISLETINNIYGEIRNVIGKYYNILYQSEILGEKDAHRNFSVDESLFCHNQNGEDIWVLGIVDNISKDFRLEITNQWNQQVLKKFITTYVETGNTIITEGWSGYNFNNNMHGYIRDMYIHGGGDFSLRLNSSSHIESIWSQLKAIIKKMYYIIPFKNFGLFLWEVEWRIKKKNKNINEKISELFEEWYLTYDMAEENFFDWENFY